MFTSILKSSMLKTVGIALFLFLAFHQMSDGADHIIPSQGKMEEYFWTYGCTPTAASMILGYWDNYSYFGRLIDFYYDNWCGNGAHDTNSVPNTIDELRSCLGTDWNLTTCTGSGNTWPGIFTQGLECVTNNANGYSFSFGQCVCDQSACLLNDWCWGDMTAEIDSGRPFMWNVWGVAGPVGHSVPAWGYRDDKYIILYDTWWPAGREDWYYSYYLGDPNDPMKGVVVEKIYPGGGDDSTIILDDPNGDETVLAYNPYTIWWFQWGTTINNVDIYYATEMATNADAVNWNLIAAWVPSVAGWNSYTWIAPNVSSYYGRIKINAWHGAAPLISADGSLDDFTINMPTCSALSYPTDRWQRVWYEYSTSYCLGDGPDESNEQFDNDWGTGIVAHGRSDDIRFSSSRSIHVNGGNYRITVGSDDGVALWIDGTLMLDNWIVRGYTTDIVDVSLSAGYHNFRLDYFENAGGARVSFAFVPLLPDLIVQSLTTSPANPYAGQDISVTVTVENQGTANITTNFYVDIYKNRTTAPGVGVYGEEWCNITSGLVAGNTTTCVRTVNYASAGTYHMWAQVDSENQVSESNENNNVLGPMNIVVTAAPALSVTPAGALISSGTQGGPFSPLSQNYTLQNTGSASLNWTASKTQTWVTLSLTSGTLAANASTTVTASINSNADGLAAGSYNDTVTFTNTTNSNGNTTRPVSLTVIPLSSNSIYVSKDGYCNDHNPCWPNIQNGIAQGTGPSIIEITQGPYAEDITLGFDQEIILEGGWDTSFASCSSYTTINGSITVKKGTMILENIILK